MGTEPMRLAVFVPSLGGGGAERAAIELAGGFARRNFEVDLVLARAEGPWLPDVPADVRLVDLGARRVATSVPALARYLRRERPTALAAMLSHANLAALWATQISTKPDRVVVVEQNTLTVAAENGDTVRARMMPRLARFFYPRADYIVGVSQGVVDDLHKLLPTVRRDRIRVIHNPVVGPSLLEKSRSSPDHPWFNTKDPIFLAAGRLTPQKDFPTLISAFRAVARNGKAKLIILGDGPDRVSLERQVEELRLGDCVALPGYTNNPYAYMAHATAYVLSSRWEGLPTVLIEAMACGVPLIATDCPSGPREILADGAYGRLVPVGDVRGLAAAMEAALSGALEPAPESSWGRYEVEAVVDEYLAVLNDS